MCFSEKPSGCSDIEQAGVTVADGQGSRVKLRLLWIGIFSMCVTCNIAMFVWIRSIENKVNAQISQKLSKMHNVPNFLAKYDDENDDNEDYPASVNLVVRALAEGNVQGKDKGKENGKKKGKKRNRKRHKKGKRGCQCSDLLKKLKSKRDVSGQPSHILTYMRGMKYTNNIAYPFNNEGIFLWQKPDRELGNYFQYNDESTGIVKAILIGISGTYELNTQVTLGGHSASVDMVECGVELIKSRGGIITKLARSVLTQTQKASYGQSGNIDVLDNVKVGGIFYLAAGDEVPLHHRDQQLRLVVNTESG
ncbi:hypothetical protein LOTGIDRAFT_231865 [Lottia gigantea]|uniref:Uncharacterized protein n=1 Tax=Lottia gigantea TaxID=225164 RepID=V4AGZ0_LOTGI|nr:hypothetical protein LOTGIDRAFT_231865 [Lottia gigantea]ESO96177.1 hypothetical protein LOTGIDRAFT_231865 [Lottia gigantea]